MGLADILLSNELPEAEIKEYKIKRLSAAWNTDVVLKLKALSYNRVAEIKKMDSDDTSVHIILAGETEGTFKNKELMEKYHAPTPVELVKKIFTPGEIDDLSIKVERLSGYRKQTIEDIKKNS